MKKPISLFVGLRYLRARKGSGFASFVSAASVMGVALGVATLIVVLSVMNGFENELRVRLLGMTSHASIVQQEGVDNWPPLVRDMLKNENIIGASPYIELEAMMSGPGGLAGAVITGIEPNLEHTVSQVGQNMILGSLDELHSGERGIVLGRVLAHRLGVTVGDRVAVLVPQLPAPGQSIDSQLVGFSVTGLFELGVQDHDSVRAMIHIDDADGLGQMKGHVSGIRVETTNIFTAPEVVRGQLQETGDRGTLSVIDWTEQNASYFRAIRIEKTMMTLLLSLIIGVAAFNIVATLVMVVTEKRSGIAILRTLGCSRRDIVAIFVLQGTLIGWLGALVGIALGISMALNIDTLAPALESILGFQFMPADLYYLTSLPSDLQSGDVVWTSVIVLVTTALATIYPALRAASVQPAEVLRYE
ncbi:MAG: lipoprotein-releasing ABC transporter permease subunit [Gammaproteobacteria bacterium]|nr:lipoprotein-releasing ABC transporter permease subunit [Gammaproteobacteria bacterium]MCP4832140.1 lipoprotein-releasing ABC transporter permease subunit [Gammaproteobacteria bacterium]